MATASPIVIVVADSVTKLPPETDGGVVIGGSHGAVYAAYLSARAGARAAIHHDAGIGRDEAGVSGLAWAQKHGMAMATVAASTARIGNGNDMLRRGLISRLNELAAACGVYQGQPVAEAAKRLEHAPWPHAAPAPLAEGRTMAGLVLCVDSLSMADQRDRGRVVSSGSHGGVPAGETAALFRPALALFNDAGFGIDDAGVAGLDILDRVDVPGATVAASSARIGDGRSTLTEGVLSKVNGPAYRLGGRVGSSALALARSVAEKAR